MRHLRLSPRDAEANVALGVFLYQKGRLEQSEFYFARAVELAPTSAAARSDHANALMGLAKIKEAIAEFRESLRLDPEQWLAYSGLAQALTHAQDYAGAIEVARAGLNRSPSVPNLHDDLSRAFLLAGRAEEAAMQARKGIEVAPANQRLHATLAIAMTYADGANPEAITAAYAANGRLMCARAGAPVRWKNSAEPDRVIRVGFLSSDFREHSVAYFLEPVLANLDAARIRSYCYVTNANVDDVTRRMRATVESRGGAWVELAGAASADIADRIRRDGIDILIELGGHSYGNRLNVMIARGAPIQVDYLGWATTTGLPVIDYRIVDSHTDPVGTEHLSTEKLVRMDPCFLCFRPAENAPTPARIAGPPTFGSFNALPKLNRSCIAAWSEAMQAVPNSRMIVKASGLEVAEHRERVLSMFALCGIARERIDVRSKLESLAAHRELYGEVDIALDTFPYNGTTTTCEALWMGVPVITIEGRAHAGRVSASILHAVKHPEWIARDQTGFVAAAAALMADSPRRAALRASLRDEVRTSALCDGPAFGIRFSAALRAMWRDWCAAHAGAKS